MICLLRLAFQNYDDTFVWLLNHSRASYSASEQGDTLLNSTRVKKSASGRMIDDARTIVKRFRSVAATLWRWLAKDTTQGTLCLCCRSCGLGNKDLPRYLVIECG